MKRLPMLLVAAVTGLLLPSVFAQAPLPVPRPPASPGTPVQAPAYTPAELERIVSPIALYPDPLLAQILAAATFASDIPDAARWADDHHHLAGSQLTAAIVADQVPWDAGVQALLPFPSVLEMMANDMPWTQELGEAFLSQREDVMDAVQRLRQRAQGYGYLRSCAPVIVNTGPYIEILPANPAFMVVPYYDPQIIFVSPVPPVVIPPPIYCGYGIRLGAWFAPWGWGTTRFVWASHGVIISNAPWGRTWGNRGSYIHPYSAPRAPAQGIRPPEQHHAVPRTPRERQAERPKGSPQRGSQGGRGK